MAVGPLVVLGIGVSAPSSNAAGLPLIREQSRSHWVGKTRHANPRYCQAAATGSGSYTAHPASICAPATTSSISSSAMAAAAAAAVAAVGRAVVAPAKWVGRRHRRRGRRHRLMACEGWRLLAASGMPFVHAPPSSLRQIIVVHRHGARFPSRPVGPADLSWPQRKQFWDAYRGHLTPVGVKQVMDAGEQIRRHYLDGPCGLLSGISKVEGNIVSSYTSNVQRTLQSAWSWLLGALGSSVPIFFAFRSDRVVADPQRRGMGVPIYIEDAPTAVDKLFHEWKLHRSYDSWLKENQRRSRFFQEAATNPAYLALLDKLHAITGLEKLSPDRHPIDRMVASKDVDTLVRIQQIHAHPLLPNSEGISLEEEEMGMLRSIAKETKRCWFQDSEAGSRAKSWGKRGAGYLAHKIWRHLSERASGRSQLRLVEFSCHDTTLAALANVLGVELPRIDFGAHFIIELHEGDAEASTRCMASDPDAARALINPQVRILYNPSPEHVATSSLVARVPPLGDGDFVQHWDDCLEGSLSLDELKDWCCIPQIEECFAILVDLMERRTREPTREQLLHVLERSRNTWLSLPEWRKRYWQSFQAFDKTNEGLIGIDEVRGLLSEWGHNSDPRVTQMLWELFDRGPDEKINHEEFYLMMQTLVGMRGSLSKWHKKRHVSPPGPQLAETQHLTGPAHELCLVAE